MVFLNKVTPDRQRYLLCFYQFRHDIANMAGILSFSRHDASSQHHHLAITCTDKQSSINALLMPYARNTWPLFTCHFTR